MELASIIVPIYNAENEIKRCLESIIGQTYKNTQIILVDDGSTDNSFDICEEYAAANPTIELYRKENGGVSSARNYGLQRCRGKYIFFVDADDYILPEFIEHFMEMPNCPFIGGGYVDSNGWKCASKNAVIDIDEYKRGYINSLKMIPSVHVNGNRYEKKVIDENGLRFQEDCRCGEDARFNIAYFSCIDRLCATERCEYIYVVRPGSAVNSFWPDRLEEERGECEAREKFFFPSPDFDSIKYLHWHTTLEHYYGYIRDSENGKLASQRLKEASRDKYFRSCIPHMIKNGTKDMKIEGICLFFNTYPTYKRLLTLFSKN